MFDALVIGAGPAGSSTALLLSRSGWNVALVEKSDFPRRKVCGEFISSASLPVLKACGVAEDFLAAAGPVVNRIGLYAGAAMLASPRKREWGRALGREHLDTLLRDGAVRAGARLFQPADIASIRSCDVGSICTLQSGAEIEAKIVIAACGSWNAKGAFAMPPRKDASSDLFAFKGHFRNDALPPGLMPLLAFPGGYGGMVHSDEGRLSLSCCIRRDVLAAARQRHGGKAAEAVIAHIRATTRGADMALEGAAINGSLLSTGPIHPGVRPRHRNGVFYAGNIAGEAHPVIAEGISMAIQSGALLAHYLVTGRAQAYASAWNRKFGLRVHAASVFAHLAMRDSTRGAARIAITRFPRVLDWGAQLSGKA